MSDTEMLDGAPHEGAPEPSEDGEGDDIAALSDDSSEEAGTDEEEAANIRQGFIVDDDEEEARYSESEDEETVQKKRKKRRRKRGLSLEADDLDLVAENTGRKFVARPELSRIRRGRASPDGDRLPSSQRPSLTAADLSDDDEGSQDINDIFDDAARGGRGGLDVDDIDMDDMDAFIDDDEDDDAVDMGEEERAQRRAEKKRSEAQRRKAMDARPELAGIDPSAWDEIYDVFGAGDEYDWALDGEDEPSDTELAQKDMRYKDVFEPAEIAARFLTADDDVIRAADMPERMQLTTSSLSPHATLGSIPSERFPDDEISSAAEWVATRLSSRVRDEYFFPSGKHYDLLPALIMAVSTVLQYTLQEYLEAPYVWVHRRDHISVFEPGKDRVTLLDRDDLWRVHALASKYRALYLRRKILDATYEKMHIDDRYYEIDVRPSVNSVEGVSDAMEWLALKHKKAYQDAMEFDDTGETQRQKKPNRVSQYDVAKASVVSELAHSFGIEAPDIVRNIVMDRKQFFTEDQNTTPLVFAESFVNPNAGGPSSPEDALSSARMVLAMELGKDPQLRQLARERFRAGAVISVKPTEKGVHKIDDQHPFAPFKYLLNKSVQNMLSDAQWLHILAAETDHLVTVEVALSQRDEAAFRDALARAFYSDGFSDTAKAWNHQRAQVIEEVVEKHLYAVGVKHVREWLREEVEEQLAAKCAGVLEQRIDTAPYQPREFDKGEIPAVLVVSWGKGDPQKDAIYTVFMDEAGHVREHTKFDNLMDPEARADFSELVRRRKPDVVAVGGFSILTVKLWDRVREVIGYGEHQDSFGREEPNTSAGADGLEVPAKEAQNLVPVIWVPDQVARIFQHSRRAAEEFGSLPTIGRYCAALARYIQSPLNEYAALGADITAISFHEDQQLLPSDKLLTALERSLVSIVNDVGVDVNRAVTDPYYRHLLPFVAGLGPRKAQAVLKKIGQLGGTVLSREQFITEGIMTAQIFINAAGFLKISQDDYETGRNSKSYDATRRQDPLDATRIHPEDYDLARKMASGALELDEEDFANLHPSAAVAQLMQEEHIQQQLDSLSLDEFAQNLLDTNKDRKRHTLDVIHDELLNPFAELRPDFEPMLDWEVLTMLAGETKRTLVPGRVVTVTISRIRKDQVDVRLDSGIEGNILKSYLTATGAEPNQVVKLRQSLQAVITSVHVDAGPRVRVGLASREDAIVQADSERPKRLDKDYDHAAARQVQELQERKQRSEANRTRRIVKHPAFKNFNSKEAENHLAPLQHGDAVIRPSSKGPDHLAVTWKVADGVYQHIDVVEPNAEAADTQARSQFTIDNRYFYSDLDDLLVNHVKAMSRKVDDLMASEKYKGGSDQDLHNWLTNFVKMNPNRSSYAFGLNRQKAGYFNLSFLANINSPVQTWQVKVTPTAYRLGEVEVGSVPDLCDAFKRKHQKDMKTMANGGKTPYGAGRMTPGRLPTGVTPGYGTAYGKTPNPYQPKTPAYSLGKTPNPHQPPPIAPPTAANQIPPGMNPERWRNMQQTLGAASPAAPSPNWRW